MGNYMGTSEVAEKWGRSQATISKVGKVKGAEQNRTGRGNRGGFPQMRQIRLSGVRRTTDEVLL